MILHVVDDDLHEKWFLLTLYTRVLGMGCTITMKVGGGGGGDMMLHDLVDGDLCVRNSSFQLCALEYWGWAIPLQ